MSSSLRSNQIVLERLVKLEKNDTPEAEMLESSFFHSDGMEILICTLSLLSRAIITFLHDSNDMLNY